MSNTQRKDVLTNDRAQAHKEALLYLEDSLSNMRPFGREADTLFQELDALRREQVNLALEHLAVDEGLQRVHGPAGSEDDFAKRDQENSSKFAKRQIDVGGLMSKLDHLSKNLSDFHERMSGMHSFAHPVSDNQVSSAGSYALSPPPVNRNVAARPYAAATTTASSSAAASSSGTGARRNVQQSSGTSPRSSVRIPDERKYAGRDDPYRNGLSDLNRTGKP
ncbi:hypothetical protein SmJEL517_g02823 [Synchytrium microbalum]|uniref:Uncharacterized protein n=1 Tax=Synchytrium microbalum TaxID=1806994 RepID=A0A507C5V1_9FUNG|nr:uncharacterized protein SmJEL517_g02823 [Synchytrium microbalum]TPX34479.1 hypothetical protein SmJEL517_g02823 [Synchytrium microbalum]